MIYNYYRWCLFKKEVLFMKNKHLTLDERIIIENQLNLKSSFKKIAKLINKDCSTISKEIRNNLEVKFNGAYGRSFNNCLNRSSCTHKFICSNCSESAGKLCRNCKLCLTSCKDFIEEICPTTQKPPYVCNSCNKINSCTLKKNLYKASFAQRKYSTTIKDSRSGFIINSQEINYLNSILIPLIKIQNQSIHHVFINNKSKIMHSEKTIYNLIDAGILDVRNIDLPRKVRFKIKRKASKTYKVDKKCLLDRTYEDYIEFINHNPDTPVVEIDSVEGKKGGKVLLTIHFVSSEFMLAFIRDRNDAQSVCDIFNELYNTLGKDLFKQLFKVILTDNGSEFSDPSSIELDKDGNTRTSIFYCHPSAPYEKGSCEVNHELFRKFFPKGESFDMLTQENVNLIMSHINSYARKKLNNKSPLLLFSSLYDNETLKLLGIHEIPSNEITLSKSILK